MRRIGIRYYDTHLTKENFEEMRDGGMDAVEISLVQQPMELDFRAAKKRADETGIEIWSTHLPFKYEYSIVRNTAEERKLALELNSELIRRATDIGCDKFVIHPSFIVKEEENRAELINYSKEALNYLAELAFSNGAQLAVENMIPICLGRTPDELLDIISVNDKLRVCFDVNHVLMGTHEEIFEKFGDKIITCHISDYDFVNERHWFPGEGKNDWPKINSFFNKIGYNGVWMYELSPGTINDFRSRELTVRDFYNNAHEIFEGKIPSRI